jgi:hypothetical protein
MTRATKLARLSSALRIERDDSLRKRRPTWGEPLPRRRRRVGVNSPGTVPTMSLRLSPSWCVSRSYPLVRCFSVRKQATLPKPPLPGD